MGRILITALLMTGTAPAAPQHVAGPLSFYFGAGLTATGSDTLTLGWNTGYHIEAGVGLSTGRFTEVVVRLGFNRLPMDHAHFGVVAEGGGFETVQYGAELKLNLGVPGVPLRPYLLAGGGVTTVQLDDPVPADGVSEAQLAAALPLDETRSRLYVTFGAGLEVRQFYLQGRFVQTSVEGITYSYFPFTVGLHF